LGSFEHFEGKRSPLSERVALADDWIALAHNLGTDLIQFPGKVDSTASGDIEIIVRELRELAHLGKGASPPVSFAYEALAWGTYVADWEESWRVVKLVNRDNFDLCHVCHDYGATTI
jgi:4-hydroxyphenylpyruvate dioxygenase